MFTINIIYISSILMYTVRPLSQMFPSLAKVIKIHILSGSGYNIDKYIPAANHMSSPHTRVNTAI